MSDDEQQPKRNFIKEVLEAHMAAKVTTNQELSDGTGLSRVTLNQLRRGHSNVLIRTIRKLADYFQWGPEEVGMAIWYADVFEDPKKAKKTKKEGDEK